MAFKRYAALLAGSALAGSALFAQPAMAEEAAPEPAEFSYTPVTVETGQQADSEDPSGADDCTRILPVNSNKELAEKLGANVDIKTGVVTFDQTELEALPETGEYDLQIACAIDAVGEKTEWKIAPIKVTVEEKVLTFNAITAEQGAAVTLTQATAPTKFENLEATTDGFTLTTEDDAVKLTVGAAVAEGEKTVDFTYDAYGKKDLKGSFKVTVKTKTDEDEDKDEPKENASSKASSNFLGSFKGSSK